ncbi:acyl-CoA/acyl-ACP dehydrogenase [Evansella sp. LMS18]|uniref:acyl-CoA dehydrogenase family protein n=1 Tax=Evansella sp. LMS18 TaxID=2924033 RepID=UPI0020D0E205|nr:acyl-CoA dehydrogenase family protein [Evansella sp. LMS18]UTR08937.1 acyl-CoA/acyl-ACP dehydrogenase [Evansella sp. LMS18]
MFSTNDLLLKTDKQKQLYSRAASFLDSFSHRAAEYDETAQFPRENFEELKAQGMTALTVPGHLGGEGISLYEFLLVQETLAQGDGATALSLGWHNGIIMQLRDTGKWPQDKFENLAKETIEKKLLVNAAATEPSTGSPARGGKPATTAVKNENGWLINGKKTFTSLAPVLDRVIITATVQEGSKEYIGEFLLNTDTEGIRFDETWNTLGMRATRSDDLILKNVQVHEDALVATRDQGHGQTPQGWLLHIPACYLGIAIAARNEAVKFAKNYQPSSLPHPVSETSEVRRKTAEIDMELMKARYFMYYTASLWDEFPEKRTAMGAELAAVKTACTNSAVKAVDLALRIAGGQSLHKNNAFERYYRDVRAGLHNPPPDDITMQILGKKAYE